MQVLELHFNPKKQTDIVYDSFCYEPENIYEKRLGSLYLVGGLANITSQNARFLNNLATVVKTNYYTLTGPSPQTSLTEALKAANKFLGELVKKGNVEWLGNLDCALFSIRPLQYRKKFAFSFNFTKTGKIKIIVVRENAMLEVGKNLEAQDLDPYPLKIFFNTASGTLQENDRIIVATPSLFEENKTLIQKIAGLQSFSEKQLKTIFQEEEKRSRSLSGICFLAVLAAAPAPSMTLALQEEPKKMAFLHQVSLLTKALLKKIPLPHLKLPSLKLPQLNLGKRAAGTKAVNPVRDWRFLNGVKSAFKGILNLFQKPKLIIKTSLLIFNKKFIPLLLLTVILLIGFFVFRGEKVKELKTVQEILMKAEEKILAGQNFLILQEAEKASALFQAALAEILPQTQPGSTLEDKAIKMKEVVEEKLLFLNQLEKIESPEVIFELKPSQINLIPQKMVYRHSRLYFFNQLSADVYELNINEKNGTTLSPSERLLKGVVIGGDPVFFARAGSSSTPTLFSLVKGEWVSQTLDVPADNFNFNGLAGFSPNQGISALYFLDTQTGQIAKYIYLGKGQWSPPQLWLKQTKHLPNPRRGSDDLMAIDGSIWILSQGNVLERYYEGAWQEALNLNFFPVLEKPSKIWTSPEHSYLYLLEPVQNRLVILTKQGKVVKQYQSEKFNNLLDFAVSEDSKTIWLLNGFKVFQIKI